MRKFDNIIHSNSAPPTNSLWLHNDKLQYHNNGKWTDIVSSVIQDGAQSNVNSRIINFYTSRPSSNALELEITVSEDDYRTFE